MTKGKGIQKFLGPQKGSRVRQGYFTPHHPEKYMGDPSSIVYRSSWELKFLQYCDQNEKVLQYAAEPIGISYWNPILKKQSNYWIDTVMVTKNEDGSTTKWMIEVKPDKYLTPPEPPKILTEKKTLSYAHHAKAYIINSAKFEAAREYATLHNMRFGIITENFLFNRM